MNARIYRQPVVALGNHAAGCVDRSCGLGQSMSGVIIAMRRTLLSRTSLVRSSLIGLATAALPTSEPAWAGEPSFLSAISTLFDFNRPEIAVLATALAPLGFSVVAAILLMRSRVRATRSEARLRADIADLQIKADRYRALLFAEPQVLISWDAGDNRPRISGDIALLVAARFAASRPRLRSMAASGAGVADGACGQRVARGR